MPVHIRRRNHDEWTRCGGPVLCVDLVGNNDLAHDLDTVVLEELRFLQEIPPDEVIKAESGATFVILSQGYGFGVRGRLSVGLIEQAEPCSRLYGLGDIIVDAEPDGYVIGGVGGGAIRVVRNAPVIASNLESTRADGLTIGDTLHARVALDVEHMTAGDDGVR